MPSRASDKRQRVRGRHKTKDAKKNMLDGIRTRNPQIRSLVRYPLRHEHLLGRGQGGRNDVAPPKQTEEGKKYLDDN